MPSARQTPPTKHRHLPLLMVLLAASIVFAGIYGVYFSGIGYAVYTQTALILPKLNTKAYDAKLAQLAHLATTTPFSSAPLAASATLAAASPPWPVHAAYPLVGALLPFNRIVAYYGNFYSTNMGVLGEYPPAEMLARLASTTAQWTAADPTTPVVPALDYIAVVAQGTAGADGNYIARMPDSQIDKALALASTIHGLVILDVQVGRSNLQTEVPLLQKYLEMPTVELAVDPEFAVDSVQQPGKVIGTLDASDINYTAGYLANLVRTDHLPPKILIVHRFTDAMVTNAERIKPLPEVQVVMDMDGWGSPSRKVSTYLAEIQSEPVQFTGFKLFYKNDLLPPSTGMMTPSEVLGLTPSPSFIQYQ